MTSKLLLRAVWMVVVMVLLMLMLVNGVRCIPNRELDSMLHTLRLRGYDLFSNAIVTSDLQIDLSNANHTHSFTFFAPTDASLFALDMTQTASSYTDTLRFHVVPRRISLAELRRLPDGYMLPTLLPHRRLLLTHRRSSSLISVSGVGIAFPGLFYGHNVAVHGLAGILSLRSNNPPSPSPVLPPIRSADNRHSSPRISPDSPENQPVLGTVPNLATFNVPSRRVPPSPVEDPASEHLQAPESGRIDAPEPEPDWTVHPPVNLGNTPVVSPPRYPDSGISLSPEGYSDAAVPAPVDLDLWVREKDRVYLMETNRVMIETAEKYEALDGIRNCEDAELDSVINDHFGHMQCYAA